MSEYREYKKWLKDTLPKLEEWAESNEDDAGDCPLVQDEACWILGLIKDTESERDRLKAELDQQKLANKINSDEWRQDRDRYKALSEKYKEALEKISKDTIRVEYRGEDLARYETSETAKVAKEAIALESKDPCLLAFENDGIVKSKSK